MPKLRVLSGNQVRKFLEQNGFVFSRQKGSHIILKKLSEIAIVPEHTTLDRGTCHEIFKQALKCIPNDRVTKFFCVD